MSIVRENLMTREGYKPYCGDMNCRAGMPRTRFVSGQFQCACGWRSGFEAEFIEAYQAKWAEPSSPSTPHLLISNQRESAVTTIYWSGTEEQQNRELAKACKARCKQYGKADCPRPDIWCDECEHDQALAMRTTDLAEIAAIKLGDL